MIRMYGLDPKGHIIIPDDTPPQNRAMLESINEANDDLKKNLREYRERQKAQEFFYRNEAPVIIEQCEGILASDASKSCKKFAQMTIYMIKEFPCD